MERIKNGDIVTHFKKDMCEDKNAYTYKVLETKARETDNYERMVVYMALYDKDDVHRGDVFTRKYDEFMSEVDRVKYPTDKYPSIKQKYRFEVV